MLKRSTEIVAHVFAGCALGLLAYRGTLVQVMWMSMALGACYVLVAISSGRGAYLYPGALLMSTGYLTAPILLDRYDAYALLALPVSFVLYGLSATTRRRSHSVPLDRVGHAVALWVLGVMVVHSDAANSLWAVSAMAIYTGLYLVLAITKRAGRYLFGASVSFSMIYYFALTAIPQLRAEHRPAYYVAIGIVLAAAGYLLGRRSGDAFAQPVYVAAAAIATVTSAIGLVAGDAYGLQAVLLLSALIYGLGALLTRRDEYVYLISLSLGFLLYDFMRISGDLFSRRLVNYFLYGLILTGLVFVFLLLRDTLRYRRPTSLIVVKTGKGAVLFSLPLVLFLILGAVSYATRATENPKFCGSCHTMKTQYEAWAKSAHRNVECVACHRAPGLKPYAEEKITGVMETAKYLTGMYGTSSHAQVSDEACLRGGCHAKKKLFREIQYLPSGSGEMGVKYNHEVHLTAAPMGIELRCASCHSHVVDGEHFSVSQTVCFQCHLSDADEHGVAVGTCMTCHDLPKQEVEYGDVSYSHVDFLEGKSSVECTYCHREVTKGSGGLREGMCKACHFEPEHPARAFETIHEIHVSGHKVECFNCHVEVRHGIRRETAHVAGDCQSCHSGQHQPAERVYSGKGGMNVEERPDPMFSAGVDCVACHRFGEAKPGGKLMIAKSQACDDCHGEDAGYGALVEEWQTDTKAALARLEPMLKRVKRRISATGGRRKGVDYEAAQVLYERARGTRDLVIADGSLGVHNVTYVEQLLSRAGEDCERALAVLAGKRAESVP